jgi:glycine cleavage system H lipoate-binding protein
MLFRFQSVPFPENRCYCKNHLWFEQQWEKFFNIGIDDIGVHYLQHINGVSFSERTLHFQYHAPLFSLAHNEFFMMVESYLITFGKLSEGKNTTIQLLFTLFF